MGAGAVAKRRRLLLETFLRRERRMAPETAREAAGEMVHEVPAGAERILCAYLGHPPAGEGGESIPPGTCCRGRDLAEHLAPLHRMRAGAEAEIQFLIPTSATRLDRLAPLGIVPGARVRILRLRPVVILEIGETTLALDREVAGDVYVLLRTPQP
jgi:DtxR family Mn-dependent transcriptional regulator